MAASPAPGSSEPLVRVVIACQGGGSHTAFTAGVLKRLLVADPDRYRIVGLSGTSGGAVCALLAWSALREDDPSEAAELLERFWADNAATGPVEQWVNAGTVWAGVLQGLGAMPVVSPYDTPVSVAALEEFRRLLEKQVDFASFAPDPSAAFPLLLVGAVDVLSGEFRTFHSRRDRITVDAVLASAAIPNLFRAVRLGGRRYWDGLFSQNPPVRELIDAEPDELWVIQINPKERETEPQSVLDIADRRNELSGNLSLYQELRFIEKIDQLLADGQLAAGGKYRQIMVRVVELSRARLPGHLGPASKLNRDPRFLRSLIDHGERQAEEFLTALAFERAWTARDGTALLALFADDAELIAQPPFAPGVHRGRSQLRRFVDDQLCQVARVDPTHKQVARDRVVWTVRARDGETIRPGRAEAELRDGLVTRLWVGR